MGKIDFLTSWAPTKKVPSRAQLAQGHSPLLQPEEDSFWKASLPSPPAVAVGDDEENGFVEVVKRQKLGGRWA